MLEFIAFIAIAALIYLAVTAKTTRAAEYWGLALVALVFASVVVPIVYRMIISTLMSHL